MRKKAAPDARPIVVGKLRRCDNCNSRYIPRTKDHRFHSSECRAEYHRHGPVLLLLRDRIDREVETQTAPLVTDSEFRLWRCLDQQQRARYRSNNPELARQFEAKEAAEA